MCCAGTLGFEGFVVSDANAVRNLVTHGFAEDLPDAGRARRHRRHGHGDGDGRRGVLPPPRGGRARRRRQATLDVGVRRVLEAKLRLGLLDNPYIDEDRAPEVLADPAHREVARVAAERSAVLLRNEGDALPLDPSALGSVAVVGPLADSRRDILGPWCFDFDLDETVTILDGIRARAGDGVRVDYAPGIRPAQRNTGSIFDMFGGNKPVDPEGFDDEAELRQAVDLAAGADVAVVVVGEWQNQVGEQASRSSLELPGRQQELLEAVAATGTPVVLLVMNGRPLDLRWAAEHVPAILDVWYPGSQGGAAVANLLFGDVSPGGKLPFTWPRSVGQVPMILGTPPPTSRRGRTSGTGTRPAPRCSPSGTGCPTGGSTTATYPRPGAVNTASGRGDGHVSNTSARTADEVVQLYIHQRHGTAARPVRELKGFERVTVPAGESRRLTFTLGPAELRYWNAGVRDWVNDASTFDVWVGGDSTAELASTFTVPAGGSSSTTV